MNFVDRVKGILLSPRTEWPKIAAEPMTAQGIYTNWVMILGAIGPLALLAVSGSLAHAIGQYLMLLIVTGVVALIVDLLSPSFGGRKDYVAALKLAAFSYTAPFLAGILVVFGAIGALASLAAAVYAWYTFFLGAPILEKCAPQRALPFTIVVVIAGMALGFLFALLMTGTGFGPSPATPG